MKTEAITTEQQLNDKLAELQIRKMKSRAKKRRWHFYEDVSFLGLVIVLFILSISAPYIPNEELGTNILYTVAHIWQLLPIIMIINALKRVIANKSPQHIEEA